MTSVLNSVLLVLLLAASLLAAGCSETKPAEAAAPISATSPGPVPVAEKREIADPDTFVASGPLIVEHQVDVGAQRDGIVTEIRREPGAPVKDGEVLALLDDRQIQADLEAARAKTRSTEADLHNWEAETKVLDADYERAKKMWDAQLITKEQLDHARYKAESDQWDVKRVQEMLTNAQRTEQSLGLELEKTRIRAPFSGIVARRYVRSGQQVSKGDRLFWVTATGPLRLRFTLPEHWAGVVKRGETLDVTTADDPREGYRARIVEISPVVDPSSATIEVVAEIMGQTHALLPGMTANIHLNRKP
jgi:membrane fusion protein (multidrug efflux system)